MTWPDRCLRITGRTALVTEPPVDIAADSTAAIAPAGG
jgi:hypothetical protein